MIKLRGVNKYFNKGKKNQIHVINDTSLDLGTKGLVALLGPSGSGKTTLLNAMGGLDKVNKGDIFVNGEKITGKSTSKTDEIRNINIGYIFQDYKLVDSMTVYENVAMVLRMIGIKDEKEIKKRTDYVLETLGIYRYRNRMADMLSGGERQRVGIARAIAKNPKIIIADEPTGNLDSANTIEIMNIIKAISRDRLVVLVTHEVELARFYASRIIELKDGVITADYGNDTDDNLDYRLDNKFYLKDFEKHEVLAADSAKINFYGAVSDDLDMDIVVKNGNIYIRTRDDRRVEVIDSNSAIELVDDHYREMDKSLYEDYKFDFDKVADTSIKEKYSSIIGFVPSMARGFKKIARYPLIKKLLFIGFLLAGIFITYSLSSIYASLDVKDKDFIQSNKNYLDVEIPKISVEKYLEYEDMDSVSHMFAGSSIIGMKLDTGFYYQSAGSEAVMTGSLTDVATLKEDDIKTGEMPDKPYEIAADRLTVERLIKAGMTKQVGIAQPEDLIGKTFCLDSMKPFVLTGLTDIEQPLIYADSKLFTSMIYNSVSTDESDSDISASEPKTVYDYKTYDGQYSLKKGRMPENDYEVIVPYSMAYQMPMGKETDTKVNGHKLKVTGYYQSPENMQVLLANENTIKYDMISKAKSFSIDPSEKDQVLEALHSDNVNVKSAYEAEREKYTDQRSQSVKGAVAMAIIILAISLIEILLMTRSSFLSRIKEIGIYRAIGVKKTDIYKMFLGEIFAITTVSSLVGIGIMSYMLYRLCKISYLTTMLALNPVVVLGSVIIVYLFNSLVGLIPVFATMRKTPAAILARHDVD